MGKYNVVFAASLVIVVLLIIILARHVAWLNFSISGRVIFALIALIAYFGGRYLYNSHKFRIPL